ncbi:MAG: YlcI/YnfO family protein [Burkholderiaceae bacterium]
MSRLRAPTRLRLPASVKEEVARRAKADGTSFNQFVATAVAEKAAMNTAAFFAERRDRADFDAF